MGTKSKSELGNINTLVSEILRDLEFHKKMSKELGYCSITDAQYEIFKKGVQCLQDRFLRAMETDSLVYKK